MADRTSEQSGDPDGGGRPDGAESTPDRLLRLARDEVDKGGEKGNLRFALECLERYRDEALQSAEPQRVFETLPIARRITWSFPAPASVRAEAQEFVQTMARRLAPWPELAREYDQQLLETELDEVTRRRSSLLFQLLPSVGVAIAIGGIVLVALDASHGLPFDGSLYGAIAIAAGVVLAGFTVVLARARVARLDAEAENLRRKMSLRNLRTPATATASQAAGGEYFGDLVNINVENLGDYYTQVRVHTNNSFWASIGAGGVGFALIAAGLVVGFSDASDPDSRSLAYVATASGVIVEFISGVFFYLYNRTVRQLKEYHDSLLDVQNILLSFRIVEQSTADHQGPLFEKILHFLLQQRTLQAPSPPAMR
jgi:uncharacterized membrane protein YedE/YeeE